MSTHKKWHRVYTETHHYHKRQNLVRTIIRPQTTEGSTIILLNFVMSSSVGTIGTHTSLPSDVRELATLRSDVIAWTAFDPVFDNEFQSGDYAKSIPLDSISNCKNVAKRNGCLDFCIDPPPTLLVTSEDGQEIEGSRLAHQALFIREILNRRDIVKGRRRKPNNTSTTGRGKQLPKAHIIPTATAIATPVVMERGITKSTTERIKDIADLRKSGVLTDAEYSKKRQEIIDSM